MPSTFEKLNLKNQAQIVVLNVPERFEHEVSALRDTKIRRGLEYIDAIEFLLAFVTKQGEVDAVSKAMAEKAHRRSCSVVCVPEDYLQKSIKARSVAIRAGKFSASSDLKESRAFLSTRIGRRSAFVVWNLSRP